MSELLWMEGIRKSFVGVEVLHGVGPRPAPGDKLKLARRRPILVARMSFLSFLFGRRTPPAPAPPAGTLVLTGDGLGGAAGPVSLTVAVGERTFTATATRKALGDGFPAEYALHGFEELVPEREPQFEAVLADAVPDPRDIAVVRLPLTDADRSSGSR